MEISIPVIRLIRLTGQWKIPFLKITIEVVKVTAALHNLTLRSSNKCNIVHIFFNIQDDSALFNNANV
jgi:hypothetical protein